MDHSLRRRVYALAVLAFMFCSFMHGCSMLAGAVNRATSIPREEQGRWPNPGKTLDAVVATFNGGATVALGTEIHLVAHGQPLQLDPAFRADHVEGIIMRWVADHQLEVTMQSARTFLHRPLYGVRLPGSLRATGVDVNIHVFREWD